ncbi:PAS domain S-box protein [Erythrobacter sp. A6_0]|nr:PAS domain S-box protein [Erythrobacter sp. A6_0]
MIFRRPTPDLKTRAALANYRFSPDAILLMKEGAFVECNAAAEQVYGVPRAELIGQNPAVFSAETQADGRPSMEHVGERVQQALAEGFARFEWFNVRGGERVRMIVTLIPLPQEGADALLVQCQDFSETGRMIDAVAHGLARLEEGDLTARLDTAFSPEFEPLRISYNSAAEKIMQSVMSVTEVADALQSGCRDIREASDDLSSRTERQAASLEESAAAMQQVTQTVRASADTASQTEKLVKEANDNANKSTKTVDDATQAMANIERASREIGEIISVIDGIAFQTNLLALNAGVEAARAGEAGRGFAVVASEVRALAQRSADAAKDVKARIEASVQQVDRGVALVSETGEAFKCIVGQTNELGALIAEISEATRQQAVTLGEINLAVGDMDGITQQNAAMVEETTAAVRNLAQEADHLIQSVETFRTSRRTNVSTVQSGHELRVVGGRR